LFLYNISFLSACAARDFIETFCFSPYSIFKKDSQHSLLHRSTVLAGEGKTAFSFFYSYWRILGKFEKVQKVGFSWTMWCGLANLHLHCCDVTLKASLLEEKNMCTFLRHVWYLQNSKWSSRRSQWVIALVLRPLS